jgi:hypothetical protein
VKQVEDWNITVESFAFFPTVPLLFDEESWKALWPIINKTPLEVREVMQILQQEQKQNELKKKDEENQRRQQEESERMKKPSLKLGREEKSINLQPNRHYAARQTLLLRKQFPLRRLCHHQRAQRLQVKPSNQLLLL